MTVHQLLTSFTPGDAIGNEALVLRDFLRGRGVESELFALHNPRRRRDIHPVSDYPRFSSAGHVVLFHFSIGSPVTDLFAALPDRKVVLYHNVTPWQTFVGYHSRLAEECRLGREELLRLAPIAELALGDSEYNRRELQEAGFRRTGVLPLVLDFTPFDGPPLPVLTDLFADGKTNLLTVGRLIPAKRVEDVLRVFTLYQRLFNPESRLFVVGEHREFTRYLGALQRLSDGLQPRYVHLTGHLPLAEVVSYYRLAHLYLHMSEHEGFCAPLLESFHVGLPVVAMAEAAVPETMAGAGLLVGERDPLRIAALIDTVLRDPVLTERIVSGQRRALAARTEMGGGERLLAELGGRA